MAWTFHTGEAVYKQIADRVAVDVINNAVLPTQRLPKSEDMSRITGASVKVVEKAYEELLSCAIAEKHGDILIVSEDLTGAKNRRNLLASKAVSEFVANMQQLGLSDSETLLMLRDAMLK